jgi:hypothetical protein
MENMKIKFLVLIFIPFLFSTGCSQADYSDSNLILSFEAVEDGMPKGWTIHTQSGYSVSLDSVNVKSEKYSIVIESTGAYVNAAQSIALVFPNNYEGEKITLSGYMKTENVDGGFAGLAMQAGSKIAIDWMDKNGRLGTADWEKYEVTLDLDPSQNQEIIIGGLFGDQGKMWMDDLQVTIDGKNLPSDVIILQKISIPLMNLFRYSLNMQLNVLIMDYCHFRTTKFGKQKKQQR